MKGAIWNHNSSSLLPIPTVLPLPNIHFQSLNEEKGVIISESFEV